MDDFNASPTFVSDRFSYQLTFFHMKISVPFLALLLLYALACEEQPQTASTASETTTPSAAAPGPAEPASRLLPPYPITDSSRIFTVDGVQIYVVEEGKGPKPKPGSNVMINYRGTLTNGDEFDSSFGKDGYVDFSLNGLIEGWKIALPLVPTGSKVKLIVPPDKGYGAADRPGIPANSVLIFDIELVSSY